MQGSTLLPAGGRGSDGPHGAVLRPAHAVLPRACVGEDAARGARLAAAGSHGGREPPQRPWPHVRTKSTKLPRGACLLVIVKWATCTIANLPRRTPEDKPDACLIIAGRTARNPRYVCPQMCFNPLIESNTIFQIFGILEHLPVECDPFCIKGL